MLIQAGSELQGSTAWSLFHVFIRSLMMLEHITTVVLSTNETLFRMAQIACTEMKDYDRSLFRLFNSFPYVSDAQV